MKKKNNRNTPIGVSIGILLAWVVLISWALIKEMETDIIVLFVVMMLTTAIAPLNSLNSKSTGKCS